MNGLVINPFLEGVILIAIGVGCWILGAAYQAEELRQAGNAAFYGGLGYTGAHAVAATKN
jgi:hypothetical protein